MSTVDNFGKEINMTFKLGEKVRRKELVGEIIFIDETDECYPYLVGIKGYQGQNLIDQEAYDISVKKGYEGQCQWFMSDEIESVEKPLKPIVHPVYGYLCLYVRVMRSFVQLTIGTLLIALIAGKSLIGMI